MPYKNLRKGRYSEPGREYFITTVVAKRRPLLHDLQAVRSLVEAMKHAEAQNHGQWLAWVAMPDHFHGLLSLGDGVSLSRVMNLFKGRTAYALNRHLGLSGQFWQPGFHDHALRAEEDRRAVARYIVANPLRKGLVKQIGDYPYWDSVWL